MASNEDARAAREAKLDELHEKLTGAVESLVSGDDWRQALAFAARFRSRSFNNTMLIWVQHEAAFEAGRVPEPFPTLVAGYRQWQGLGRQVMKGQPGYMIFAPVTGRFASSNPADPNSWRRLGPREKHKVNEVVRSRMVGARPAYVWDASQTDGEPLPVPPAPTLLEGEAPSGLWEGLAGQIRGAGFEVLRVPHEGMISGAASRRLRTARTTPVTAFSEVGVNCRRGASGGSLPSIRAATPCWFVSWTPNSGGGSKDSCASWANSIRRWSRSLSVNRISAISIGLSRLSSVA